MTKEEFINNLISAENWIKIETSFGALEDKRAWIIWRNLELDLEIYPFHSCFDTISPKNSLFPQIEDRTGLKIERYYYNNNQDSYSHPKCNSEIVSNILPFVSLITDKFFEELPTKETIDDLDRFKDLEF